jgi:hypothetical protein
MNSESSGSDKNCEYPKCKNAGSPCRPECISDLATYICPYDGFSETQGRAAEVLRHFAPSAEQDTVPREDYLRRHDDAVRRWEALGNIKLMVKRLNPEAGQAGAFAEIIALCTRAMMPAPHPDFAPSSASTPPAKCDVWMGSSWQCSEPMNHVGDHCFNGTFLSRHPSDKPGVHGYDSSARAQRSHERSNDPNLLADLSVALDDWLHQYAPEHCDDDQVRTRAKRIFDMGGTLYYLAGLQKRIRAAIEQPSAKLTNEEKR